MFLFDREEQRQRETAMTRMSTIGPVAVDQKQALTAETTLFPDLGVIVSIGINHNPIDVTSPTSLGLDNIFGLIKGSVQPRPGEPMNAKPQSIATNLAIGART